MGSTTVEVTAEVGKDDSAQGAGAGGVRGGEHSSWESGQSRAAGVPHGDGEGATWSPWLTEGKRTRGVGFGGDAAESKLWKGRLEPWPPHGRAHQVL